MAGGSSPPLPRPLVPIFVAVVLGVLFELVRPLILDPPEGDGQEAHERGGTGRCVLSPLVPTEDVPAALAPKRVRAIRGGLRDWWRVLPDCPFTTAEMPDGWRGGAASQRYHPGASSCFRSPRVSRSALAAAGIDPALISPGQQCCYDLEGRLIRSGPAAGTPDLFSPADDCSSLAHDRVDVELFEQLGWEEYVRHWPPNPGRDCSP